MSHLQAHSLTLVNILWWISDIYGKLATNKYEVATREECGVSGLQWREKFIEETLVWLAPAGHTTSVSQGIPKASPRVAVYMSCEAPWDRMS